MPVGVVTRVARQGGGMSSYQDFLTAKVRLAENQGFEIDPAEVNPILFPHQRDVVCWAVVGGRRALFESFGLGKTMQQIEIARLIRTRASGPALICLPLGVRQEFMRDGAMLGVDFQFIKSMDDMAAGQEYFLTNYESVLAGKIDPGKFTVASLDEAAVLRSFGSKTYQEFLPLFAQVPYRFVATATPDPNRHKELIHYAAFLGIMDSGQALTRFFARDSEKAGNLTLYPHKEAEFWLWVHSWAVFLQRPSDLGYPDTGYDLPPLDIRFHEVAVDHSTAGADRDGQSLLFRNAALGVTNAAREKRETLTVRVAKMGELIAESPDDHFLLWHDLESEREAIGTAVPDALQVYGSLDLDTREQNTIDFADGRAKYLATKPELSGAGPNLQRHCHRAIFVGVGYKFHDFIQAIHRIQRFGQLSGCIIDIIYAESEREIVRELQRKWMMHDAQLARMALIIREYGLNQIAADAVLKRSMGISRREMRGEAFTAVNNDCVDECRGMEANSVDFICTSVPFSNHYEYSPSYNDFGHTDSDAHFFAQMDFLTPELMRVLRPGRLAAIHVKDRILFGSVTGFGTPTVNPFHAKCIAHYQRHGFAFMGMITIVTDVVRENNQTYRLGWSENCKDGTKMGVGSPEYVLLMRKLPTDRSKAYADVPVQKSKDDYTRARWQIDAHAFWRSSGNRLLSPDELAELGPDKLAKLFTEQSLSGIYSYEDHVKIGEGLERRNALPATFMAIAPGSHDPDVWHSVNRMRTLNGEQARRGLEAHICPLQFDIVDRLIGRYTNAGDTVLDPFGGLMTVPLRALHMKRRGVGIELSPSYFIHGVRYLQAAERELSIPDLFAASDVGIRA
jgi:DNA modification methylase